MSNKVNISGRIYLVYFGILAFSVAILIKMFNTQITVDAEEDNVISAISEVEIHASRGNIFADDVEKSALAISVPIYDLRMDVTVPKEELFYDKVDSLGYVLSKVVGEKSAAAYASELKQARNNKRQYFLLARKISYSQMKELENAPILRKGRFKGGRLLEKNTRRQHPFGVLAERTVGYFNAQDTVVGLEGAYKDYLKGTNGLQYKKNVGGGLKIPVSDDYLVEPKNGMDIYTTIDVNLQDVAERSLMKQLQEQNAAHGCAVLMEVKTGKIKAIANLSKDKNGEYRETYNHAIGRATEPGSTFKLPSLMVALEDGKVKLDELLDTRDGTIKYYDRVMRDAHEGGEGLLTVEQGFAKSSNVITSQILVNGYKKNPQQFVDGLRRMGLGQKLGLEIKGEGEPYIKDRNDSTWSGVSLPWMSIGYETKFTPLQILTFYNAVANNGKMVKPMLVKEVRDGAEVVKSFETEVIKEQICSPSTIKKAQSLLELVVEEGTGQNLKNSQFKIAGKTGTTQLAYGSSGYGSTSGVRHQASFCGYFPADNPKYSCIVVVAAPTKSIYGNVVSGTVFKDIADRVYALDEEMAREKQVLADLKMPASKSGYVKDLAGIFEFMGVKLTYGNGGSDWGVTEAQDKEVVVKKYQASDMPVVKGMGLRDALAVLENKGYHVKVEGRGVVKDQALVSSKVVKIILS